MKKLFNCLLIIQLAIFLCGCCCPCAKKAPQQNQENQKQTEQAPSN